ncbi:hypothetical protein ASPBRDRAFT_665868 [Aspergillus brasiliensis CBS 101740]|uniref:Uncharacterized protein n=1 Tax=Aspergillus brasiliensis (strain CBS 101740 / IMI 381727 / IBT 21946) TaxID=767769 RepID=A0A1L9U3T1_ASPBC|nr:hypothetical protein ASPBRDRAFT_665868 [Aspergillus brasiliensis CBS 101740]
MGPPSETYDQAWEDLYNYGIVKIPRSESAQLVNYTVPLASEPGMYIIELDVFHQLHCLHHLHKKAWGHDMGVNMSDPEEVENFWIHLDHCSDSIRQNLMCTSDVSTIHWLWVEKDQQWEADGRLCIPAATLKPFGTGRWRTGQAWWILECGCRIRCVGRPGRNSLCRLYSQYRQGQAWNCSKFQNNDRH